MEMPPPPGEWGLPPAIVALQEGRGTGWYGGQGGMRFEYGWPKYGPVSRFSLRGVRCSSQRTRSPGSRDGTESLRCWKLRTDATSS